MVLAAVFVVFALPKPEWVYVGDLSDFPPRAKPYEPENAVFFVVNTGGELIVLSSQPPHPGAETCRINWDAGLNQFRVPCVGAWFALDGGYLDGASPRDMDRHAYKVEGDKVWVEVNRLIPGAPTPTSSIGTPLPASTPAPGE